MVTCSVVVAAYNAAGLVGSAVSSALDQAQPVSEVVVVDDGSTDNTAAVVTALDDPRVRLVRQDNRGVAEARNRGIALSRGELVAFLDADDVWYPDKTARQVQALAAHPEWVAVGAHMHHLSRDGRVLGVAGTSVDQAALRLGLLTPFPLSTLMVRRSILDEVGGFEEMPGQVEDLELLSRLALRGPVGCVEEILGGYRVHAGSASARSFFEMQRGVAFVAARLAARERGGDLTFEQFHAAGRRLHSRRVLLSSYLYRSAGLAYAEQRRGSAALRLLSALVLAPRRTVRRLRAQRGRLLAVGNGPPAG